MMPALIAPIVAAGIGVTLLSIYTNTEEEVENEDYQRTPRAIVASDFQESGDVCPAHSFQGMPYFSAVSKAFL